MAPFAFFCDFLASDGFPLLAFCTWAHAIPVTLNFLTMNLQHVAPKIKYLDHLMRPTSQPLRSVLKLDISEP